MTALNYLIKKLEETYDVWIVISSTWKADMRRIIDLLRQNNLELFTPTREFDLRKRLKNTHKNFRSHCV